MKNITIVLGTARNNNQSEKVFNFTNKVLLSNENNSTKTIKLNDFILGKTMGREEGNPLVDDWAQIVNETDLFIFIVPEYNHSYPGELKILIDSLFTEYKNKEALLVTTSAGQYGGVRVQKKLEDLLFTVGFKVMKNSINISNLSDNLNESKLKEDLLNATI